MPRRQLPRLWLMTDARMGEGLWPALAALPRGAGVVFRHRGLPRAARRALFERVRRIARARGLLLLLAGTPSDAIAWRADGVHGRAAGRLPRGRIRSVPAHDAAELVAARRAGAALAFLSPLHPTRSHPGARALRPVRFARMARRAGLPVIALGGMTAARARSVVRLGASGWAAIDGLAAAPGQRPSRPKFSRRLILPSTTATRK